MELEAQYLESVPQTKYLSAENYVNYRAIMRVFYQEHQKMHYQLDKQTIMGELRQDRLFSAYTDQQLTQRNCMISAAVQTPSRPDGTRQMPCGFSLP